MKLLAALLALSMPAYAGDATTWYLLSYDTPPGQTFTGLSGEMVIPKLPQAATYYLWPGLQPTDDSGVYQNVLDGTSGTWWFGSGWCCSDPSLPWGGGFSTHYGETVNFSNTLDAGHAGWTTTIVREKTGESANNTFALGECGCRDGTA